MGCCLALLLVPLLLLATPQRATLQGLQHRTGAGHGRARVDATLARLPTSWTIPVAFAALITSTAPTNATPANAATATTVDTRPHTGVENLSYRQALPTTTTTTTAPPPPAPVVKPVTTTTAAPAPPPKPVVAPPKPVPTTPQSTTTGEASWYGAPAGTCASPTLAFGTVVTVTDVATGAAVRCTVDDREAHTPGRVLDLAPATFSQLASLSVGVIEVRLSW
jgi:rare lipoprotein A (peptidoglycan hydrolase)